MGSAVEVPRTRPRLLPASRWGKAALFAIILFALMRSVLWASVQPAFFAPDEDYHWNYVNYLVVKHTVPNLNKGEYTAELANAQYYTDENQYFAGPRTKYDGHPKQILSKLGGSRQPALPKPRPVLHPPAYYIPAAIVDEILWHKDSVTRLTGMRWYSAALGALTIYFAWLLASAVLSREWERLSVCALVALQTILGFSSSTLTNDVGVAASMTATLGWCAWMLRSPPRKLHGVGLGVLFGIAIMTKATNYSLVIPILATLAFQWFTFPEARSKMKGLLAWAIVIPLILAGWWYVLLVKNTGSILGEKPSLLASNAKGPGISHIFSIAWLWISLVYRAYWFDYNSYEVTQETIWFWAPVAGMIIAASGFIALWVRRGRQLMSRTDIELRAVVIFALTALVMLLPPWGLDTLRGLKGLGFDTAQGRFLTPAFPGLAVIMVLALRELTRFPRRYAGRIYPIVVGLFVAVDFVWFCHTWINWVLERYYGPIHGHWLRALLHASYDKPAFITQWTLLAFVIVAVIAFAAAYFTTIFGSLRSGGSSPRVAERPADVPISPSSPLVAPQ